MLFQIWHDLTGIGLHSCFLLCEFNVAMPVLDKTTLFTKLTLKYRLNIDYRVKQSFMNTKKNKLLLIFTKISGKSGIVRLLFPWLVKWCQYPHNK